MKTTQTKETVQHENKLQHNILLRLAKLIGLLLGMVPFTLSWFFYYQDAVLLPFSSVKLGCALSLVFLILYATFGRVYDAFLISLKRISEMISSQTLALLFTDAVLFCMLWLLDRKFPSILVMCVVLIAQIALSMIWSVLAHKWYFHVFPPVETIVVFDVRPNMERLIQEYGLSKKFHVQKTMEVEECLSNLSILDNMECVFLSGIHSHERNIILKYCMYRGIRVFVIPRVGDVLMSGAQTRHMFHLPMLQIDRYNASPEYLFLKRAMDIVASLFGIILTSPIMLGTAIAIKATDKGPVFYKQIRLTQDGKEFYIHKFRSMRVDAEKDGVARLSTGENDDRITPVGKVIRKCRIDELPQLFDILVGNLSLCGPRPERPEIAAQYTEEMPEFALRLQAKAGLTGYAQVYGKYNTTPYDKLQMDLMYIAHPSILEDIKILMATIKILFEAESTEGVEEGQTTASAAPQEEKKNPDAGENEAEEK